jgi:hypothetical protein
MKRELPGLESLRNVSPLVELHHLRLVRELVVASTRDEVTGYGRTDVRLVLETEGPRPNVRATFEFEDCGALKIDAGSYGVRIGCFAIEDVRDRQWDGVAWRVGDIEQDAVLAFHSRTARLVSVEALGSEAPPT